MTNRETNKPRRWRVATVLLMVAIGLIGFGLGWSVAPARTGEAPPPVPDAGAASGQVYTCSMHPQVRLTDPNAKCPICGMALIPVPADEDESADDGALPRLRLSPRAAALMQVQVQPVERRALHVPVRLYGRLDFDETRLRNVNIKLSGWIEQLYVDYVGAPVNKGDPLFDLYSPELFAAQEEYLLAFRSRDQSKSASSPEVMQAGRDLLDAARTRLLYFDVTPDQIVALEARGRPAKTMTILSPHTGVVIEKDAVEGQRLDPGMRVYRLADLSRLWVQLEVYEADLRWLSLGQRAVFTTQAQPGEQFEGKVTFIDPVVNQQRRTARVRVEVANPDGWLKPGIFVSGQIEGALDEPALVIPASAPLITGARAVVYVQLPGEDRPTFEPRDIVLGSRAGPWYVVQEGLHEGELVVTHGAFKIDSELQIRGRPSMMQPEGGAPPTHDHGAVAPASAGDLAAYPLDICVVSGLPLNAMGGPIHLEHDGQPVLLCCDGCLPQFRQDPPRYLSQLDDARNGADP